MNLLANIALRVASGVILGFAFVKVADGVEGAVRSLRKKPRTVREVEITPVPPLQISQRSTQ